MGKLSSLPFGGSEFEFYYMVNVMYPNGVHGRIACGRSETTGGDLGVLHPLRFEIEDKQKPERKKHTYFWYSRNRPWKINLFSRF